MMITCEACKRKGFKSWDQYREHQRRQHAVVEDMGVSRIDFTIALDQARKYVPMDPAIKQAAVMRFETEIRNRAWADGRLNPLIGCDKIGIEPIWDGQRNVL